MNVLMDRTPFNRPTFYQYFRDRQELMDSLLEMLAEEIQIKRSRSRPDPG